MATDTISSVNSMKWKHVLQYIWCTTAWRQCNFISTVPCWRYYSHCEQTNALFVKEYMQRCQLTPFNSSVRWH